MAANTVNTSASNMASRIPDSELQRPVFEEDATQKTSRKIRENPMVPIGMAGFFLAVGYGIRHFKQRPKHVSASMYVMQFRVFAQSIAVGCMGVGMAYTIFKDKFLKPDTGFEEEKKTKK